MGEAVGCVTKAVDLALRIKDAVDTVRQNRKDCAHIKRRVERVRHTLSLCEGNAELMGSPAVCDAVEALAEVLSYALELVTGCQEETSAVCLYCTARKVSKQLGKVDRGISDGNSEATFAILVYHISKQTGGDGAGPDMPTDLTEEIVQQPLVEEETPEQTPQSCDDVDYPCYSLALKTEEIQQSLVAVDETLEQTPQSWFFWKWPQSWYADYFLTVEGWECRRHSISWGEEDDYGGDGDASFDGCDGDSGETETGEIIPHPLVGDETAPEQAQESGLSPNQTQDVSFSPPDRYYCGEFEDRHVKNGALLQKIASVALRIRTATETVRRNRDDCVQIDKLASRIGLILSQLEHMETKKDMAVLLALKSLRKTFRKAHKLVAACQRRNVVVLCSPGKLSGELRGVLDEMILGLDDLIDALL